MRGKRWEFNEVNIYNNFINLEMQKIPEDIRKQFDFNATGGGRLIHTLKEDIKDIMLFGHSVAYGKADHCKVHYILGTELKDQGYNIRWSNSTQVNNKYSHLHNFGTNTQS